MCTVGTKEDGKESARAVTMDACGYAFIGVIPAVFLFTIFSLEYHRFPLLVQVLHRFDRYGVMFFFLGSWWQVFLITALRARRTADNGGSLLFSVWVPYLVLGAFISALILWVAPFNLMWVSIFWFVASFGLFAAIRVSADKICKVFMILAIVVLVGENISSSFLMLSYDSRPCLHVRIPLTDMPPFPLPNTVLDRSSQVQKQAWDGRMNRSIVCLAVPNPQYI